MTYLGVEVPQGIVEAVEVRMKRSPFRYEDLIETCRRAAPRESREFHSGLPGKLIQKHRRIGSIRGTEPGQWKWLHRPTR
jgi:hypothetical protein